MRPEEISRIVQQVVERVVRRLDNASRSDLPTLAGPSLRVERQARLKQAIALGACRITPQAMTLDESSEFAAMTEMTLLRPDAREADVSDLCREAKERGVVSVCVGLDWVEFAASMVSGSDVRVCVPVGFPLGGISTEFKAAEIRRAVALGADEVDVVMNVGRLRAADHRAVVEDLQAASRAAQGRTVKAVIEAADLTQEQKVTGAILAKSAGAQFVKSSTGFGPDGVTVGDVALLRCALTGDASAAETAKPEWAARVGAVVCVDATCSPASRIWT